MFNLIHKVLLVTVLIFSLPIMAEPQISLGEVKNGVRHLSAKQASQVVREYSDIVILDIRTPAEFAEDHIAGALNIDYYADSFKRQLAVLDKDKTYLVHCRTGGRSGRSLKDFRALGFKRMIHLDGGIKAWRSAGFATVKE